MAFKLPPITVLPGGRKVRDYDHLTVEYQAEQKAAAEKKAEKEFLADPKNDPGLSETGDKPKAKKPAKAEDESLG